VVVALVQRPISDVRPPGSPAAGRPTAREAIVHRVVAASDGASGLAGKRIVWVLPGEALGGAERNALDLGARLVGQEGASVEICALSDRPGRGRQIAAESGIGWHPVPFDWSGGRRRKLIGLLRVAVAIRRLRPDVLVSSTNLPNIVCGFVRPLTGARQWAWVQCDVLGTERVRKGTFEWLLRRATLVVTGAHQVADWLVDELGADRGRICVIYSEVRLAAPLEGRDAWRERLGLGPPDLGVCMLGHLHARKDHATLLRAWRHVVDELGGDGIRAVLVLAGRPAGSEDALKALAYDLDLREHLVFVGDVVDVGGLLGAVDLAVFSSRSEGLGRGATEPMAADLAVAGTDVAGIREAVGPDGVRFLAAPGDARGLADAMLALLRDPALRREVGAANAELIRRRQSAESTTDRFVDVLSTTANGHRE